MKNKDYWKRRFEILEEAQNNNAAGARVAAEREFNLAQRTIDDQIRNWYGRFAENNKISLAEAHHYLSGQELAELKWDVDQYIKYGKENALNQRWMKQLENASARVHISRQEALKLQTQDTIERLYGRQLTIADDLMRQTYTESYFRSIYEVQRGAGVGWDTAGLNEGQVSRVLSKPWTADGATFSDRIWTQRDKLVDEVHTQLSQNMILGRSPDGAIKEIATKFKTSKANAGRLVMTESAYFASEAEKDALRELGVDEYEIIGTLDSTTCALCGAMDGEKGRVSDFSAGVTAPPFHPMCRCTTAPYFTDDADGERIARDENGETYYVPEDMKYEEWKERHVDDGDKNGKIYIDRVLTRSSNGRMRIPMDLDLFNKGKREFEEKGGVFIQSEEGDRYLSARGADAITLNEKTIIFKSGSPPTLSEYYEELMHVSQFERDTVSSASITELEIETKEYLIKNQKKFGIPDHENEETKQQLDLLLKLRSSER